MTHIAKRIGGLALACLFCWSWLYPGGSVDAQACTGASLSFGSSSGAPGSTATVSGSWTNIPSGTQSYSITYVDGSISLGSGLTVNGSFQQTSITIPASATPGSHTIKASTSGCPDLTGSFTVTPKLATATPNVTVTPRPAGTGTGSNPQPSTGTVTRSGQPTPSGGSGGTGASAGRPSPTAGAAPIATATVRSTPVRQDTSTSSIALTQSIARTGGAPLPIFGQTIEYEHLIRLSNNGSGRAKVGVTFSTDYDSDTRVAGVRASVGVATFRPSSVEWTGELAADDAVELRATLRQTPSEARAPNQPIGGQSLTVTDPSTGMPLDLPAASLPTPPLLPPAFRVVQPAPPQFDP
ncbi:MAG: hypothetical protein HW416_3038, partial [Chloroflexi bacterium]|nr:hypothetical protein [Chloroflexota bacterium]